MLRFAMPSSGALCQGALDFMNLCGLKVRRANSRTYTGFIPSLQNVQILFQRQSDITSEIDNESVDAGIVGLDSYHENRIEQGSTRIALPDAGFGAARLTIAVPSSWSDATSLEDLADLSLNFRDKGRDLRIATKYPRLVNRFIRKRGVNHFSLVKVNGALEVAPLMGYADVIADISDTGSTLRENGLTPIAGGVVLESTAIIVANVKLLAERPEKLNTIRKILDQAEAALNAQKSVKISAKIPAESRQDVEEKIMRAPNFSKFADVTVLHSFNAGGAEQTNWYEVQTLIWRSSLDDAIEYFRSLGGVAIAVQDLSFRFRNESRSFLSLSREVDLFRDIGR